MEGFVIAVLGGMFLFAIGVIVGAILINDTKTLLYNLLPLISGFIAFIISGNILRIYENKNPGSLGSSGEAVRAILFCGFLCMPLGMGALVGGSIGLIAKQNAKNSVCR